MHERFKCDKYLPPQFHRTVHESVKKSVLHFIGLLIVCNENPQDENAFLAKVYIVKTGTT